MCVTNKLVLSHRPATKSKVGGETGGIRPSSLKPGADAIIVQVCRHIYYRGGLIHLQIKGSDNLFCFVCVATNSDHLQLRAFTMSVPFTQL